MEKIIVTLDTPVSDMKPGQYFDILLNGEKAVILAVPEYGHMCIYIVHNSRCLDGDSTGRNYWRIHREEGMPEFERSWYKSEKVNGTIKEMLNDIRADVELIDELEWTPRPCGKRLFALEPLRLPQGGQGFY